MNKKYSQFTERAKNYKNISPKDVENISYSDELDTLKFKSSYKFFSREFDQIIKFRDKAFGLLTDLLRAWNRFIFGIIILQGIIGFIDRSFLSDKILIAIITAASISNLMGIALKFIFSSKLITVQLLQSNRKK